MPLNCLPETTTVAALEAKREAAQGKCRVDWMSWGGAVDGNAEHLQPLAHAGVPGYKCFLVYPGCEGFTSIDPGDVIVTGDGPYVVEFAGALAKTDVPALTGVGGKNEKQTITLDAGVSDGTFTLTFGEQTTEALAYNISANDLQTALRSLTSINGANVAVTAGDPSGWVVEFIGALAKTDVGAITGDGTSLVGDVKDVTIVETVKGNLLTVGVVETFRGNLATVGVTETVKGNLATVGVVETAKGHLATVNVTETQKGDAGFTVGVTKTDASAGSNYSWIAC